MHAGWHRIDAHVAQRAVGRRDRAGPDSSRTVLRASGIATTMGGRPASRLKNCGSSFPSWPVSPALDWLTGYCRVWKVRKLPPHGVEPMPNPPIFGQEDNAFGLIGTPDTPQTHLPIAAQLCHSSMAPPICLRCFRNVYDGSWFLSSRYAANLSWTRSVVPARIASA